jgi:hypothetical protein
MGFQVISSGIGGAGGAGGSFVPTLEFQPTPGTSVEISSITFCNTDADTQAFSLAFSPDGGGGGGTWRLIVFVKSLVAKDSWIWGTGGGAIMTLGPNDVLGLDPGENVDVVVFGKEVR